MTTAAFAVMMVLFSPMFSVTQRMSATIDMSTALKDTGQTALNRMTQDLNQACRIFLNDAAGNAYLAGISNRLVPSSLPALLTDSRLSGYLSDNTEGMSLGNYASDETIAGNCLLMASRESPRDMSITPIPNVTITNFRLDSYRFNFYYLAKNGEKLGGKDTRNLYEWHSASVADYSQISAITAAFVSSWTIKTLLEQGVQYAWDPSGTYTESFYQFLPEVYDTAIPPNIVNYFRMSAVAAAPVLAMSSGGPTIKILSGSGASIFNYGVSPNTDSVFVSKISVPKNINAGVWPDAAKPEFPSGFEVKIQSYPGNHMVYARLIVVALGKQDTINAKEHVLLVPTKDVY